MLLLHTFNDTVFVSCFKDRSCVNYEHQLHERHVSNTCVALIAYIKPSIVINSFIARYFEQENKKILSLANSFKMTVDVTLYKYSQSRFLRHFRRSLCCREWRFETRKGHGFLSLVTVVCYQTQEISLRRDDHSSRGVLPREVCLRVIPKPQKRGDPDHLGRSSHKNCTIWSINVTVMIVINHQSNFF
jgi:hypothetical protein